jgi:hypothetical protein
MKNLFKVSCVLGAWLLGLQGADAQTQQLVLGYGTPTEVNVPIGTVATNVGSPGTYRVIIIEDEGTAGVCLTFGTGTLVAPSSSTCSVGAYLGPGAFLTLGQGNLMLPNTQLRAIAASAATATIWESVQ